MDGLRSGTRYCFIPFDDSIPYCVQPTKLSTSLEGRSRVKVLIWFLITVKVAMADGTPSKGAGAALKSVARVDVWFHCCYMKSQTQLTRYREKSGFAERTIKP